MCVDEGNHLLICLNKTLIDCILRSLCSRRGTDIVHAFEDHRILHTRVGEHIAVDAAERIGAQTISEDTVATRCKISERDVLR